MKFNIYKSVAMCSLLALAGCHDFEELNTDPYAPIYDPTVENVSPDGIDRIIIRPHRQILHILHQLLNQAGANTTNQVIRQEAFRSPHLFQHPSEHPYRKHIKENM